MCCKSTEQPKLVCLGSYLTRFLLAIYGEEKESASIQNLVRFCQSCLKYLQFFGGKLESLINVLIII